MNKDNMTDLIIDYLDNTLTAAQKEAFEAHMKKSKLFAEEVEEYRKVVDAFIKEEKQLPSKNLEAAFLKTLEEEKSSQVKLVSIAPEQKNWTRPLLKMVAGLALLITIFYLGRFSKEQESNMRIQMANEESNEAKQMTVLAMMENQSANKRIQGVEFAEKLTSPDEDIIKALSDRMQFDENINVRLVALEALSNFASSESVKKVFLETLETEKNPSIQIALIKNLVRMQEKKAVSTMKKILEQEDTQPFIKDEINSALPKII